MAAFTYRERSLAGHLIAQLLVYIPYLLHSLHAPEASMGGVTRAVVALVVLIVLFEAVVAATTRNRRTDERDLKIWARSCAFAYLTLAFANVTAFTVALQYREVLSAGLVLNLLLAGMACSTLVHVIVQLVAYRRAS